ncbi:MAG: LemA protein [Patescibacteria group bacterium]|nr:LemA protein [Patescibacteria group bacterium]
MVEVKGKQFSNKQVKLGVLGAVLALLLIWVVAGYNSLVSANQKVESSFATVDTQYQRRADLVPNLVSTVKGAADFEQETLTQVVEARAKATQITIDPSKATPQQLQDYQNAQGEISQALGRLLAVAESYPQLTATKSFQDLQVQLEGTENRIQTSRADYNDTLRAYNTKVKRFPTVILSGLFNFEQKPYFEAVNGAENAPAVEF